jgi:cell division protein FtsB
MVPAVQEQKKFRVEFRSSSNLLKTVVAVLIVFSMAALLALGWMNSGLREQTQAQKDAAAALEQENRDLQEKIDNVDTVQGVQDIAREELGFVDPNTIVIQPESE